jgi:iron(III) transport system ATP-binding protein
VDRASLDVRRGEVFTLLGPSGCGKTTTLRLVAGLERPDGGEIILRGRVVASVPRRVFVQPNRRNLGMVFQSYAIWPHMTVFDNVAYPLTLRGLARGAIRERVARVLDLVGLAGMETRPATLLSGARSSTSRISCCWTSPSATSTRSSASRCGWSCGCSSAASASRCSSSPTTRSRR